MRRRLASSLAALAVAGLAVPTAAIAGHPDEPVGAAHVYAATEGLSEPTFETVRESFRIPLADGETLYAEVVRPKADGRFPVILELSPYHGTLADRDGTRILPDPKVDNAPVGLTGYFAPRGYAVLMVDLRGTGRSTGCLDHLGPKDAADAKVAVEWASAQPWSSGRVGMTGHSYVGSTPMVAAAQRPEGLVTIVPSAGLASMYDHQFQAGVPYNFQWAGTMFSYEQLAIDRKTPGGDDFGNNVDETGCGAPQSSLVAGEAQLSGAYTAWHAQRDHRARATSAPIPVFMVHGVNDDAARIAAAQWFHDRRGRQGDKAWFGQWTHGSGCCPNTRGMEWTHALHAWFDHHLQQRDVDTGPPIELFLNGETVATPADWPPTNDTTLALSPTADGKLDADPVEAGSISFSGGFQGEGVEFRSPVVEDDTLIAGVPDLTLVASVTAPRVHLIATLYSEDAAGDRSRITQCAINPELRNELSAPTPAIAGEIYRLRPPCFAAAHVVPAEQRLLLRVSTTDSDKVPTFPVDPNITVFTGKGNTVIELPVIDSARHTDHVLPPFDN